MPKEHASASTDKVLAILEQAIKNHPDLRVRQRARIVRLLYKGYTPAKVADLLAISVGQVNHWRRRWREEGLAGLSDRPRSGAAGASEHETDPA